MSELQEALLAMLVALDGFCAAHGISYTLIAGTLLGAVRHQGFVPWDDDVDLGMPRPDFMRLIALRDELEAQTGLALEGHLGTPVAVTPLLKVVDRRYEVRMEREVGTRPLWIDVSPVDAMPDDPVDVARLCERTHRHQATLNFLASTPESGRTPLRRVAKRVAAPLRGVQALKDDAARQLTHIATSTPWGSTAHVGSVAWGLSGERELLDAASFLDFTRMAFEGHDLPVMGCWERYLVQTYGEAYLQPPPPSQRVRHIREAWRVADGAPLSAERPGEPRRKVMVYGTFDLFHEGHENILRRAAQRGDHLTVGVTTDVFDVERGKLNVVEPLERRVERARATGYADEIVIEDHRGQKEEDIVRLGIDELVFGSDWEGKFDHLRNLCEVTYLPRTEGVSSRMIRERTYPTLRLGVLGSGRATRLLVPEVAHVAGIDVTAMWSPDASHARERADGLGVPSAIEDLDELLSQVDAVYVATPHQTHHDLALRALESGCHVLCEKPMALCAADALELQRVARERGLVLMEAIKTAYCPGWRRLVETVRSGAIGDVVDVQACFTRLTPHGLRERDDADFGGGMLEFGSYCLLPIVQLLGREPQGLRFESLVDDDGVDLYTRAVMRVGDAIGGAACGVGAKGDGRLVVAGTTGYVVVRAPWWKTEGLEIRREDPRDVTRVASSWEGYGMRYEIGHFVHQVWRGELESPLLPPEDSLALATLMGRYLESRNGDR